MKIAVMGAGAIGGYLGGRLAQSGHDVSLIARGDHLAAIRKNGLTVNSAKGDFHIPEIFATSDPAEIGPVDVVLFMVKNYDVETSANAIKPLLGPQTMVLTAQNGVSAPERLAGVIGQQHVVPGVIRFPADVMAPGIIRHSVPFDEVRFGEADGRASARCEAFHDALAAAGPKAVISEHIQIDIWEKMIMQASFSSVTALKRLDIGPLRDCAESADMLHRSILETEAVGKAVFPDLPDGLGQGQWTFVKSLPATTHASMLDDLERGKPIELNYLGGDVVRLGRKQGIPTPVHEVMWSALSPYVNGKPE